MSDEHASVPSANLSEALSRAGLSIPLDRQVLLDDYCRRLWEWNEKLNLTRHTTFDLFVERDVIDSWQVAQVIESGPMRIVDVGSGGGVPGIILAILRPELQVTLAESMAKKARVLADLVAGLQLPVVVHHGRAETLFDGARFDDLVVRAVAPLDKLLTWFQPHWGSFRRILVIKGPAWVDERRVARERGLMRTLHLRRKAVWPLPGTRSESVLLEIRQRVAGEQEGD